MPEVPDHDPGAAYGVPAPEIPFGVDLDDLQAYIQLLEIMREADMVWGHDKIAASAELGFVPVGDDLNLLDKWERRFDGLRNAMTAGFDRMSTVVVDIASTLDNISARYASTDEENRSRIDEIYNDGGESAAPPTRTGVRRTFDPFDYRQRYNKSNRDAEQSYSMPDECFVNGDPTNLWMNPTNAKAFLLNLGIDTAVFAHAFSGDWTVLFVHESMLRIHQDTTGNASENMSYGMAGLEGTWFGRASYAAADCVNRLSATIRSDGYPSFDALLDGYVTQMDKIYECADSCAWSLGWALDGVALALEVYPAMNVFPDPKQVPTPSINDVIDRLGDAMKTLNPYLAAGAAALLHHAFNHLFNAAGAAGAAFTYLAEVESLIDAAIAEVEAVDPAALEWRVFPNKGGQA